MGVALMISVSLLLAGKLSDAKLTVDAKSINCCSTGKYNLKNNCYRQCVDCTKVVCYSSVMVKHFFILSSVSKSS